MSTPPDWFPKFQRREPDQFVFGFGLLQVGTYSAKANDSDQTIATIRLSAIREPRPIGDKLDTDPVAREHDDFDAELIFMNLDGLAVLESALSCARKILEGGDR